MLFIQLINFVLGLDQCFQELSSLSTLESMVHFRKLIKLEFLEIVQFVIALSRFDDSSVSQNEIVEECKLLIDLGHKSVFGKELKAFHKFLDLLVFTQVLNELRTMRLCVSHIALSNGNASFILLLNLVLDLFMELVAHWYIANNVSRRLHHIDNLPEFFHRSSTVFFLIRNGSIHRIKDD